MIYQQIPAGISVSSILPDMDFETYSEAGLVWRSDLSKWVSILGLGATKSSIAAVGARVYAEHPSTEILMLAYDLKDGYGPRQWFPGTPPPLDLFEHIARGGLIEAWNCQFEYWIWLFVAKRCFNWPDLPYWQLRDAMAKSRAHAYPGNLDKASEISRTAVTKMKEGKSLIRYFSIPRNPTKNNPSLRNLPNLSNPKYIQYTEYNLVDIKAEAAVSCLCPDLNESEQEFELYTRLMNIRGIALDLETIHAACNILDRMYERYDAELCRLTHGAVEKASEVAKLREWLESFHGITTPSLDSDHIDELLSRPVLGRDASAARALEIRKLTGSAGIKKYYALRAMAASDGRIHDLFIFHGARTGRDTGQDAQPQNLVKQGPAVCPECKTYFSQESIGEICPPCETEIVEWSVEHIEPAIEAVRTGSLDMVEHVYGDASLLLSGCMRGMFTAGPGCDLICSDYSSIEAVVTAVLAGERWRVKAFERKEDIYLHSAARITGTPYDEYVQYHKVHGKKHPDRSKIGKPAELGLGFGGWIAAWRQFDKSDTYTDDDIKRLILAWRAASPAIPELWGGQVRGKPWAPDYYERYGLEGAAINAVDYPGQVFESHGVQYGVKDDTLYCRLLSGRFLTYHRPRLSASKKWEGQLALSFEGWNSNPKMGRIGWIRIFTYGGRLAENFIQATASDIMRYAVPNLERAGYPVVLRLHDELLTEVPKGFGSIEEVERIMGTLPPWAAGWPIRAAGGWRGHRYRKD